MSGNSAESFSEESEAEEEKEEVQEKAEVIVKKKGPGRPPRKKRPPNPSPVSPPLPNVQKRRCIPPKSGNHLTVTASGIDPMHAVSVPFIHCVSPVSSSHREAWCAEATLVRGGACSSGDSPKEKPCGTARPCEGGLRALPRTLPFASEQPARLESYQVLRAQPHPTAEEAGKEGKRCLSLLGQRSEAKQRQ